MGYLENGHCREPILGVNCSSLGDPFRISFIARSRRRRGRSNPLRGLLRRLRFLAMTNRQGWVVLTAELMWSLSFSVGSALASGVSFDVNEFQGKLVGRIPIDVPPYAGFEPDVALSYNSSVTNGVVGAGWNLTVPVIERHNERGGTPWYDDRDVFYLDGQKLVPCTDLGGTHCTEIQTYVQVIYDDKNDYWEVKHGDGVTYIYGADGNATGARGYHVVDSTQYTYRWYLKYIRDKEGHQIQFVYTKPDQSSAGSGYVYLDKIKYNAGQIVIDFTYEDRPDTFTSYATGWGVTLDKRLQKIEVEVQGVVRRDYTLSYVEEGVASRSILKTVTQCGYDGNGSHQCLPPIEVGGVTPEATGFTTDAQLFSSASEIVDEIVDVDEDRVEEEGTVQERCFQGEFNGDGRTDIVCYPLPDGEGEERGYWYAILTQDDGLYSEKWSGGPPDPFEHACYPGDFDGDGLTEIGCHCEFVVEEGEKREDGEWECQPFWELYQTAGSGWGDAQRWKVTDFPLMTPREGWVTSNLESQHEGVSHHLGWRNGPGDGGPEACFVGDYNGDGRDDIACNPLTITEGLLGATTIEYHGIYVGLSAGASFALHYWDNQTDLGANIERYFSSPNLPWLVHHYGGGGSGCLPGDFNGDGRLDLACADKVGLSTGSGWEIHEDWYDDYYQQFCSYYGEEGDGCEEWLNENDNFQWGEYGIISTCIAGDLNSDSVTDLACYYEGYKDPSHNIEIEPRWIYLYAEPGEGFVVEENERGTSLSEELSLTRYGLGAYCGIADYNGDGWGDILCMQDQSEGFSIESFTGSGWSHISWSAGFSIEEFNCLQGDFDGSATADLFCTTDGGTLLLADSGPAGLITEVTNEYGGEFHVEYASSSDYRKSGDEVLPFSLPVVDTVQVCPGDNNPCMTTSFNYSRSSIDWRYRRFGFGVVERTEPSSAITVTEYSREPWNWGFVLRKEMSASDTSVVFSTEYEYPENERGETPYNADLVSVTERECLGFAVLSFREDLSDSFSTLKKSSEVERLNSPFQPFCREQLTEFEYDLYGNIDYEKRHGDTSKSGDEYTIARNFHANVNDYLVRFPAEEYVCEGTPATCNASNSNLQGKALFYYDGNMSDSSQPTIGLLTQRRYYASSSTSYTVSYEWGGSGSNDDPYRIKEVDREGDTTTTYYDSTVFYLYPTQIEYATGQVVKTGYDLALGAIVQETDVHNGLTTSYGYDPLGRLVSITRSDNSMEEWSYKNTGDPYSQHVVHTLPDGTEDGLWSKRYYDGLGRTTQGSWEGEGEALGAIFNEYDSAGRLVGTSLPQLGEGLSDCLAFHDRCQWTEYAYDGFGRLTTLTHPDGNIRTYTYGLGESRFVDEVGDTYQFKFDVFGRLEVRLSPDDEDYDDDGWATTSYTYDALGHLVAVEDDHGNTSTKTYDWLDRVTSVQSVDKGYIAYEDFDIAGRPRYIKEGASASEAIVREELAYDSAGRLDWKKTYDEEGSFLEKFDYEYDDGTPDNGYSAHQLLRIIRSDAGGAELDRVEFGYDNRRRVNRVDRTIEGVGYSEVYEFDSMGRTIQQTFPDGSLTDYTYGEDGRLDTLTLNKTESIVTNVEYEPWGAVKAIEYGNGLRNEFVHDTDRFWTTDVYVCDAGSSCSYANDNRVEIAYTYLNDGLLSGQGDRLNIRYWHYNKYDSRKRLRDAAYDNNTDPTIYFHYDYDSIDNLKSVEKQSSGGDRFTSEYLYESKHPHAATTIETKVNGSSISSYNLAYNSYGETERKTYNTNLYDEFEWNNHKLSYKISSSSLNSVRYEYNAAGEEVIRTASDGAITEKLIHGAPDYLITMENEVETKSTKFLWALGRVVAKVEDSIETGTEITYLFHDAGGSVIAEVNSTTDLNSIVPYLYDPFGAQMEDEGQSIETDGYYFQSLWYESKAEFYRVGASAYDPEEKRWLSAPYAQYAYSPSPPSGITPFRGGGGSVAALPAVGVSSGLTPSINLSFINREKLQIKPEVRGVVDTLVRPLKQNLLAMRTIHRSLLTGMLLRANFLRQFFFNAGPLNDNLVIAGHMMIYGSFDFAGLLGGGPQIGPLGGCGIWCGILGDDEGDGGGEENGKGNGGGEENEDNLRTWELPVHGPGLLGTVLSWLGDLLGGVAWGITELTGWDVGSFVEEHLAKWLGEAWNWFADITRLSWFMEQLTSLRRWQSNFLKENRFGKVLRIFLKGLEFYLRAFSAFLTMGPHIYYKGHLIFGINMADAIQAFLIYEAIQMDVRAPDEGMTKSIIIGYGK